MRIALCLSGQPRGVPTSLNLLKTALNVDSMDVFCHAWYSPDMNGLPFDSAQEVQNGKVGVVHPDTANLILSNLNPVDYIFEPQRNFPFTNSFKSLPEAHQDRMASIFYSIYSANNLKRKYELINGFTYDIVIRARYDLIYYAPVDVMRYIEQTKTHIVTSKKFQGIRNSPTFEHGNYTLTDIFAFSSSENMDVFCSTYPHMTYINSRIHVPYGENYLGYRVRVMGGIEAYCATDLNYEIMHRVVPVE